MPCHLAMWPVLYSLTQSFDANRRSLLSECSVAEKHYHDIASDRRKSTDGQIWIPRRQGGNSLLLVFPRGRESS